MEVRNDYTDDQNYTHIDFWEDEDNEDSEGEGRTVAIVCRDTKKVYYIDNRLRGEPMIIDAVNEVLAQLNAAG